MLITTPLVTSSISHQKQPSNWALPELAPTENCPDISGQYIGLGESIKNKTKDPLAYELFMKNHPLVKWQEVSHISIQQNGQNLLNIVAWKDNEIVYSESLSKDSNDFTCEEGWLKITRSTSRSYSSSAGEISSVSRSFTKADGYLLEKRERGGILLLLILPIPGSSVEWLRFAPYEETPQ